MAREKRTGGRIFALFIIILLGSVAYYIALFANTADSFLKRIVGQS